MREREHSSIGLLRFETIEVNHAYSTRRGGVSLDGFASLNIGWVDGEQERRVVENRGRVCTEMGVSLDRFVSMQQAHTANVEVVTSKTLDMGGNHSGLPNVDGLITAEPGIMVMAKGADCPSVLLYDPVTSTIGVLHSGWRGTFANITGAALHKMMEAFGTCPKDVSAGVGPCISGANYEVGPELIEQLNRLYPDAEQRGFYDCQGTNYRLDLARIIELQLRVAGVTMIEHSGYCTFAEADLFYSYRRDGAQTGRNGLFAVL